MSERRMVECARFPLGVCEYPGIKMQAISHREDNKLQISLVPRWSRDEVRSLRFGVRVSTLTGMNTAVAGNIRRAP
jgi:hypothetical protein